MSETEMYIIIKTDGRYHVIARSEHMTYANEADAQVDADFMNHYVFTDNRHESRIRTAQAPRDTQVCNEV